MMRQSVMAFLGYSGDRRLCVHALDEDGITTRVESVCTASLASLNSILRPADAVAAIRERAGKFLGTAPVR